MPESTLQYVISDCALESYEDRLQVRLLGSFGLSSATIFWRLVFVTSRSRSSSRIRCLSRMPTDLSKFSIEPFDGTNFATWKWHLVQYLTNEQLMDVVLGTRKPKEQEANKINLILAQALRREQLVHIIHKPTPSEKWSHLCDIYESADDSSLQRTAAEFYGLKYEENQDIASFLSNVSMLTTRLEELKKPVDEAMIVAKILASLPASYEMFCVSWSSSPAADKTMANLTSRLLQEEARQLEKIPRTDHGEALFVKRNSRSGFTGYCFNCGKRGHRGADCLEEGNGDNGDSSNGLETTATGAFAFTGLDRNAGIGFNNSKWLADSGATSHMCSRKDCFCDLEPYEDLVQVANGKQARVVGKGTVRVVSRGQEINIENVKYVPSLTYSLFSIGAIERKNCVISIADGILGVTKDGQLLATGQRDGNLYFMDFKPFRRNDVVRGPWYNKQRVHTRNYSGKSRGSDVRNWRTKEPIVITKGNPSATSNDTNPSQEHFGTASLTSPSTGCCETEEVVQQDSTLGRQESEEEFESLSTQVTRDSLAPNANGKRAKTPENVVDNQIHLAFMSSRVIDTTTSSDVGFSCDQVQLRRKALEGGSGRLDKNKKLILLDRVRRPDAVRSDLLHEVRPMLKGSNSRLKASPLTNDWTRSRNFELEEASMSRFKNWRGILITDWSSLLGQQVNKVRLKMKSSRSVEL